MHAPAPNPGSPAPNTTPPGSRLPLVAAISGAAAVIVFPLLMVGAAFGISGSDTATTVMLVAAFAGAVCALTAAVLGIVSLTRGVTGSGKALAIGAILSAVFSIVTGGLAAVFGFLVTSPALHGRPLRRRGEPVLPRATETDDVPTWGDDRAFVELEVSGLPEETRREVAAGWLEDARTEHASVAAFSRLALDLLAIGAPPRLVTRAHSAAMDEVEHARKAYAIASRFAGRTLEPAEYPEASALEPREVSPLSVARESLLEGVVGEAACAALLARGASEASNDVLGRHLARLAVDEAGHAELARDIVRHCVDRAGSERASMIAELRRAIDRLVVSTPDETRDLRPYGRFSPLDFALATRAAREEARLFLDGLEASETTARHCASASIGGQDASQE